jgi:hypothetical protein
MENNFNAQLKGLLQRSKNLNATISPNEELYINYDQNTLLRETKQLNPNSTQKVPYYNLQDRLNTLLRDESRAQIAHSIEESKYNVSHSFFTSLDNPSIISRI